eukprot:TRINITY_DN6576_c0_g1_i2.p5 TRINITY_DN6576_c0_g1~~TRINITY_DN6576_c0_g1_i2.p5  ORF type:complete len:124 (-),score=2.68 TRINITY_DN6576_c0_g1_i2:250-621(-)
MSLYTQTIHCVAICCYSFYITQYFQKFSSGAILNNANSSSCNLSVVFVFLVLSILSKICCRWKMAVVPKSDLESLNVRNCVNNDNLYHQLIDSSRINFYNCFYILIGMQQFVEVDKGGGGEKQ